MTQTPLRQSLRRIGTLDTLAIIACDLALAIPSYLTWILVKSFTTKMTSILGRVVLSTDLMMQNPSIAALNVALFRQASLYGILWLGAIAVVWAISLGILNSIQWQIVARRPLSEGLSRFAFIESLWYFLSIAVLLLCTFVLFAPERIPVGIPVLILVLTHLSLGLHIGLLQRKKDLYWKEIPQLFIPSFQHGWRWLLVYALLCGVGLLSMIVLGLLVALGMSGVAAGAVFGLIALAWWRMISWEILNGHVKRIP